MILSDRTLVKRGHDIVDPFVRANVQPASIDLRLDTVFLLPLHNGPAIDLNDIPNTLGMYHKHDADRFVLHPHEFALGSTLETVKIPADLVGCVEGRSSLGRLGLSIHITAGFIDPGFEGKITLEFYNANPRPIILQAGLRVCQLSLTQLTAQAMRPYGSAGLGSHYQGQTETTASRYDG